MKTHKYYEKLIEAGMTDKNTPDILKTGALPFGKLSIPGHYGFDGNNLYFWDDPKDDPKRNKVYVTGALDKFIKIKKPEDIVSFAERYGPLKLCEHGFPSMHRGENGERQWCPPRSSEPVKRWFYYIAQAQKCLDFVAQMIVNASKITIPAKYLKRISKPPKATPDHQEIPVQGLVKYLVTDIVNEWLGDAGIRLELNWDSREPALLLTSNSIFGALGVQLLAVMTKSNIAVCSGCGLVYLREGRKPQAGRRNFCSDCRGTVAARIRKREERAVKPK